MVVGGWEVEWEEVEEDGEEGRVERGEGYPPSTHTMPFPEREQYGRRAKKSSKRKKVERIDRQVVCEECYTYEQDAPVYMVSIDQSARRQEVFFSACHPGGLTRVRDMEQGQRKKGRDLDSLECNSNVGIAKHKGRIRSAMDDDDGRNLLVSFSLQMQLRDLLIPPLPCEVFRLLTHQQQPLLSLGTACNNYVASSIERRLGDEGGMVGGRKKGEFLFFHVHGCKWQEQRHHCASEWRYKEGKIGMPKNLDNPLGLFCHRSNRRH